MSSTMVQRKNNNLFNVLSGSISLAVSTVIVKIIGFIYKLPLSYLIGDEGMGYFNAGYTAYTFFYLICTAGVPKAITLIISEQKASNREEQTKYFVKVAKKIFYYVGLISAVLFIILSPYFARLIGSPKSYYTMIAIAPSILFVAISGVLKGLLNAEMKLINISISQVVESIFKLILGIVFAGIGVKYNLPLYIISALTVLGISIGSFASYVYLVICSKTQKEGVKIKQNVKYPIFEVAKRIFSISLPITVGATVTSVGNIIDLGLVMRCLSDVGYSENQATALYGNYTTIAVSMFNFSISLITPISIAFMPLFRESFVKKDGEAFTRQVKTAFEITAFVSAPIMLFLMFFSKEIMKFAFPNADMDLGSMLLCLISPAIFFSSLLFVLNTTLESCGHLKAPLISILLGTISKFAVSYLLIRNPFYGISGAPIGTVLFYATALISALIIYGKYVGEKGILIWSYVKPYINASLAVVVAKMFYDTTFGRINQVFALALSIVVESIIYIFMSMIALLISSKKTRKLAYYTNFS